MTQTLTVGKKTRTVKAASKADGATGTNTAGRAGTISSGSAVGRSGLNTKYAFAGVGADVAKAVGKVGRPVWAEISTSALEYNLNVIRKFVNPEDEHRATPRLVLSIVKGNGYGHGGPQVAKILEKAGSDWFGVTSAAEGIEVRKAGVKKPILVLTSFWPGEEKNLLKYDLTPVVHRIEQLAQLNRAAAKDDKRDPLSFHLKIDSGMNRL